jgi:hypothetical protein
MWANVRLVGCCLIIAVRAAAIGSGAESAEPTARPVGEQLKPLIQSDWIARDDAQRQGFSLDVTAGVLQRAAKLLERIGQSAAPERTEPLAAELRQLQRELDALRQSGDVPQATLRELYLRACALARRIAFANPLLDFDKLLFISRHHPGGVFHMVDQFYGCNAKAGGSLLVLCEPFSDNPRLVDLLEKAVVENGRLRGQPLRGAVLSPELSFDGRTILFAFSQCQAKQTYQWAPEYSYHIFKINADGSGLVQLTDGHWDDFDPCFLPSGRVLFVSTRRGGYLRCGRHCPVYTMFSMNPDGSDIRPFSVHETHEWQPSVANDGMVVYTRWDYIDRDTNVAHHIWVCYPDGRDPRSYHGNYPLRRESRPWMEMNIRAIPGSNKFVATAAAHHGHALGSLVLIDQQRLDDGACSQLTRLTPEVPFPEAEGRPIEKYMVYGTAWPLSEDDYLCAYDRAAKNHGIYWIDRFGNKELIYRDPNIPCIDPIPLRPRPLPPTIPDRTGPTGAASVACETGKGKAESRRPGDMGADCESRVSTDTESSSDSPKVPSGTVAVMNVYQGDFPWPENTRIAALRVIQVLPKSTAPPNEPRVGVANQTNARAVLGTVPVEPDGSAYFQLPAGKQVYFQALDERGMAVQSMRSGTYLQPGEQLTCQGCHEPKHMAPAIARPPMALRRAPSLLRPPPEGANPFNFARLVQPVLDRHCTACHQERKAADLSGTLDKQFTRSYNTLAGKYGFYFHVSNGSINQGVHGGSRTIAGKFGARASPLLKYLGPEHFGVQLPEEDFQRIVLWLDCNSEFLGAYEDAEAQLRGQLVRPSLE